MVTDRVAAPTATTGRPDATLLTGTRVLVVTNMYPDTQNPFAGTFVQQQVEGLRALGVDVDVVIVGGNRKKLSYIPGLFRFWRVLRAESYDLIHAHYVFSGIIARLQVGHPLVVSFHGGKETWSWVGLLCRLLAPLADAVTVTSDQHKVWLRRKDAFVVPCGVDLDLFVPASRDEARSRLGLPLDKKLVLFAAIPRPEKRLDLAQQAVEILRQSDDRVQLVLATNVPHEQMPWYMNACDVLALPSEYEGSPVVVKEAMACNLPIVATDTGDVAQVIGGTEGNYVCEHNAEDLAAKLQLALNREGRTEGRRVIQSLNLGMTLQRIVAVYQHVLAGRKRRVTNDG
ncbi:MAG: putative teichuronic acid biosynthesis glycosyltransferase TuaC [Chloroflexi bacterium ADurb.Bin180]|nr:MAG: putative teichuronic acid biosynthesis glycosyltransferase TuaC [Chloroflexi bacterium ADurb.Bin180]